MGLRTVLTTFLIKSCVDLSKPNPGPITTTSKPLAKSFIFFKELKLKDPSFVSGKGRVITSLGFILITALFIPSGIPNVTNPAPDLIAAPAHKTAAPA